MTVTAILAALAVTATPDFQGLLDRYRVEQDVPGISAVVTRDGSVLYAGGSGLADIESGRVMTPDTMLYAGSLSKVPTAVLTLHLVDTTPLSLADAIPEIPGETGITVYQLLTHTSGLDREGDFGYWFNATFPDGEALADYLARTPLESEPGTRSSYSNIGYATLGLMVESVTGERYGMALESRVLGPLGMESTGAPGPVEKIARGYTPRNRLIPSAERPFAGVGEKTGERWLREYHDAGAMSPAFGVYTTANDFGRLARFLLGFGPPGLLSDELRRRILQPVESGRGLGMRGSRLDGRPVARHDGWFAAHRSHLLLDLDAGIGVIVLANSDSARPGIIAEALLNAAFGVRPP